MSGKSKKQLEEKTDCMLSVEGTFEELVKLSVTGIKKGLPIKKAAVKKAAKKK